jgi:hypothetical protein
MEWFRRRSPLWLAFVLAVATCPARAIAAGPATDSVSRTVEVRNVAVSGDQVSGVVANRSSNELRDVQLLITDAFAWRDERHPGPISPGSSFYYTVPTAIPAGGAVPFSAALHRPEVDPALGSFSTTVVPIGFTEIERPRAP